MTNYVLNAETRKQTGTSVVKRLRKQGKVPGIYYFHGEENIPLLFNVKELQAAITSKSPILQLKIGEELKNCVIRDLQYHRVYGHLLHIDLMGISFTEKIRTEVPIRLNGIPRGVKESGGMLQQLVRIVEIEVLPSDLPDKIEVDVSNLNINDFITFSDIKTEKINFLIDEKIHIASVSAPSATVEKIELEEAEETKEPEVIGRRKEKTEED